MALDAAEAKAVTFDPFTMTIERGRLMFFATATRQMDPRYVDLGMAQRAGHRDLPVPPSFFFSAELEQPDPFGWLVALGVNPLRVLHGEQSFDYHAMAYAGDVLTLQPRVLDVLDKKGGAMQLLLKQTEITRDGEPVAEACSTIVIRNDSTGNSPQEASR